MEPKDEDYLSPTSPNEESEAQEVLETEPEPTPGIDTPVRWYDADRREPYTFIVPFQERHDTSVEFFYKPVTLSALAVGLALLAYVATTQDVLEEGRDKRRVGVYAAIASFLVFSMIQFRDGPFIRPHPAFWRAVLGINVLYELVLVFLLFQDLDSARMMMTYVDPSLGHPLPEKSYAEDCALNWTTIYNAIDIFCLAHALGWLGKALILRDYWFCWILSIMFELAEYSLQHQLANFAECWWDHWLLDVLICNWLGTWVGMKICQYFEVKASGFRLLRRVQAHGMLYLPAIYAISSPYTLVRPRCTPTLNRRRASSRRWTHHRLALSSPSIASLYCVSYNTLLRLAKPSIGPSNLTQLHLGNIPLLSLVYLSIASRALCLC